VPGRQPESGSNGLECRFIETVSYFPSGRTYYAAVGGGLVQFSPVTKRWECVICGYIHEGEEPPDICPVCDAPKEFFRLLED